MDWPLLLFGSVNNVQQCSTLKASPQQNKQWEINTRMVTALKTSSCGGSYKVCETLATHLNMPSLTRRAFFQKSKKVGDENILNNSDKSGSAVSLKRYTSTDTVQLFEAALVISTDERFCICLFVSIWTRVFVIA